MSDSNKVIYYSLECPKSGNVYIGTKPNRLKERLLDYGYNKRRNHFECDCGSHITYTYKEQHFKTLKHQKFVEKIKTESPVAMLP